MRDVILVVVSSRATNNTKVLHHKRARPWWSTDSRRTAARSQLPRQHCATLGGRISAAASRSGAGLRMRSPQFGRVLPAAANKKLQRCHPQRIGVSRRTARGTGPLDSECSDSPLNSLAGLQGLSPEPSPTRRPSAFALRNIVCCSPRRLEVPPLLRHLLHPCRHPAAPHVEGRLPV
jgi:hypothetical protein